MKSKKTKTWGYGFCVFSATWYRYKYANTQTCHKILYHKQLYLVHIWKAWINIHMYVDPTIIR